MQNGLLETKLHAPQRRAYGVARSALLERLGQGMQRPLLLICAPAGFGKTSLLCEWQLTLTEDGGGPCTAWLALDKEDNDPARFWRYVLAALERAGLPELSALASPQLADAQHMLTVLLNTVRESRREVLLLLDDYHVIEAVSIHEHVMFLLEHLPANLHLCISTRTQPSFPLARLRANQQLVELYADDLRFTLAEAGQFLHAETGALISTEDVMALERRTEGWIAGLQLAALSLRGRHDPSTFIQNFTGGHRYIFDYLAEEVLARLPAEIQLFLLSTSLLASLCAPLCDAVTQRSDSRRLLAELERANVFLVSLDDERRWYRYHHLFADMLVQLLQLSHPELMPELHRRASLWYEQNERRSEAMKHALAATDYERAAELFLQEANELLRYGEILTMRRLLERFPDAFVRAHPRLALNYIWSLMGSGQWEEIEARLHELEHLLSEHEHAPYDGHFSSLGRGILTARAALASVRGDSDRSIELLQQALAAFPRDDCTQRSYVTLFLATNYWSKGELLKARQVLLETCQLSKHSNDLYINTIALCTLGNVQMLFGQLQQAHKHYDEALSFTFEHLSNNPSMLSMIHNFFAYLFYEQNELDEAQEHCAHSMQYPTADQEVHQIYRYALLARIKQSRGERNEAYALLQEAESQIMQYEDQQSMSATYCASGYLCLGELERANALAERFHLEAPPFDWLSISHLLQARLWLYRGEPAKTLNHLQPVLARVQEQGLIWGECRIMVLQALAWHMLDERERALALLTRGLSLAESAGFFRSLIDEGAPLRNLLLEMLEELARRQNNMPALYSQAYLQRLLTTLRSGMLLPQALPQYMLTTSNTQALAEPLSRREIEILHLITAGYSNQEILERLLIAKSTLKTHINHIYSKLGVRNREQAIARARQLGSPFN